MPAKLWRIGLSKIQSTNTLWKARRDLQASPGGCLSPQLTGILLDVLQLAVYTHMHNESPKGQQWASQPWHHPLQNGLQDSILLEEHHSLERLTLRPGPAFGHMIYIVGTQTFMWVPHFKVKCFGHIIHPRWSIINTNAPSFIQPEN